MTPIQKRNTYLVILIVILAVVMYYLWKSKMYKGEKITLTAIVLLAAFGYYEGHIKTLIA